MRRCHRVVLALLVPLLFAFCDDDDVDDPVVSMQDECDPATFNAALGDGTCVGDGDVTFAEFNAELEATQTAAAWRFVPTSLEVDVGDAIEIRNDGGEEHTFTEVEEFGGGIVPELNEASGNDEVAPECVGLPASAFIAAGDEVLGEEEDEEGTERYQCCIHPWMRATVTVD